MSRWTTGIIEPGADSQSHGSGEKAKGKTSTTVAGQVEETTEPWYTQQRSSAGSVTMYDSAHPSQSPQGTGLGEGDGEGEGDGDGEGDAQQHSCAIAPVDVFNIFPFEVFLNNGIKQSL